MTLLFALHFTMIYAVALIDLLFAIWFYRAVLTESEATGEEALSATMEVVFILIVGLLLNFVAGIVYLFRR